DVRPQQESDRDQQRDDRKERAAVVARRRRPLARAPAERDQRRQQEHEPEPEPVPGARRERGGDRQQHGGCQPGREEARDRGHRSRRGPRGSASQRTVASTPARGASTPPYHQRSGRPPSRIDAVWFGSAPRRRNPTRSSQSRTTP